MSDRHRQIVMEIQMILHVHADEEMTTYLCQIIDEPRSWYPLLKTTTVGKQVFQWMKCNNYGENLLDLATVCPDHIFVALSLHSWW